MAASKRDEPEDTLDEALQHETSRIEELSDSSSSSEDEQSIRHRDSIEGIPFPGKHLMHRHNNDLPQWLAEPQYNLIHDDLVTKTTESQQKTLDECLALLTGSDDQGLELNRHGLPKLRKAAHAKFLHGTLSPLPAGYVLADASRPWFFYWAMAGLSSLGEDVSHYRRRLEETVRPLQNPTGGFGGGHGQLSHCAASYATVLALACVDGLDIIDREAMWHWLGSVKESDGGFRMAVGAEEDVRGAYCAMTIITLLNLPIDLPPEAPARHAGLTNFTDRLGEWVGRCQTYEGGMAGAPTNEIHGAYAFCALACLSLLDAPHVSIPKHLDVQALIHCLASLQTTPEGGFAGRTNKLVDACYSHWVGGCWALLQAALQTDGDLTGPDSGKHEVEGLWNREALIRYLLTCCQQPGKRGGMRDKPSTRPDGYHTCYSLAGLNWAQNHYYHNHDAPTTDADSGRLCAGFNWTASRATEEEMARCKFDQDDTVEFVHPVYVIPMPAVEKAKARFERGRI